MLIIKNGQVVDTLEGSIKEWDIFIQGEVIKEMGPWGSIRFSEGIRVIDAKGKIVAPGLVDMHVHLREPGEEYKETIESGTRAAVAGGFTGVACMPNTIPVNDNASVTEFILKKAREAGLAKVYPIAAISVGRRGEALAEYGGLKAAGAVGVSDDGNCVINSELMRRAMEYASFFGLTVISHPEDTSLSLGGHMNEGLVSTQMGIKGIPPEAEEIMVFRDIALSKLTGLPVHIAHVSTKTSVEIIAWAKDKGLPVTAETAPHYFTLDHRDVLGFNTNAKVNPPLRSQEDVQAIKRALADGTIDVIATDHAPHSVLEKEVEFDKAACGIIGLEFAVPLTLELVREGVLGIVEAIRKLSTNPCKILKVEGGYLRKGAKADIAIIDPGLEWKASPENIQSKSKNTPFLNRILKGKNIITILEGRVVWEG